MRKDSDTCPFGKKRPVAGSAVERQARPLVAGVSLPLTAPASLRRANSYPSLCSGLQVILYIEEADYNPFLVTSTGAKIVVHDQDEYPFIEDIGTEIETATATSIGMHFVSGGGWGGSEDAPHLGGGPWRVVPWERYLAPQRLESVSKQVWIAPCLQ